MKQVAESAYCSNCRWTDGSRGARGRAALHAKRTGHRVCASLTVVHEAAPDPNQLTIDQEET